MTILRRDAADRRSSLGKLVAVRIVGREKVRGVPVNRQKGLGRDRRRVAGSLTGVLLLAGGLYVAGHDGAAPAPVPLSAPRSAAIVRPAPAPPPPVVRRAKAPTSAAVALDKAVMRLGERFRGDVGIAVQDIQTGWTSDYRGLDYFPQQSVSKLWVALSLFEQVDQGRLDLAREITVRREDLTLFHQPIRPLALRPGGFHTTTEDLLVRALTQSDNSANDRLLNQIGGPDMVRTTLARKSVSGVRFGPGERLLQSRIAGLDWKPGYGIGNGFYEARDAVADAARRSAFEAYAANPVDGATAIGIADALARLKQGRLLSPASTDHMLSIMSRTRTGAQRLKGGLHDGWALSHKTGTGQIYDGEQAGYNDVGILTSPAGRSYAVAVLIGRTSRPLPERMKLMQRVVQATIDYDAHLAVQQGAAADLRRHKDVSDR